MRTFPPLVERTLAPPLHVDSQPGAPCCWGTTTVANSRTYLCYYNKIIMKLQSDPSIAGHRQPLTDWAQSPWTTIVLLCALFWAVAAAATSGFIAKHSMPDGARGGGVEVMLDASAKKPYVYRQLAPLIANGANAIVPQSAQAFISEWVAPEKIYARAQSVTKPEFRFRYIVIYYLCFFSLLASLFLLRKILLAYGMHPVAAVFGPATLVLGFPYLQTGGGYYYDGIELFFCSLVFLLVLKDRLVMAVAATLLATLNKESFFFFIPTLYPLLRVRYPLKRSLVWVACGVGAAGLVNLYLKIVFFDAPGKAAEFKLFRNILTYLTPSTYFQFENTYGIIAPFGVFFGSLLIFAIVVAKTWKDCTVEIRQHLILGAVINLPLFFLFCAPGELRNLSLLFVGLAILIGLLIHRQILKPRY